MKALAGIVINANQVNVHVWRPFKVLDMSVALAVTVNTSTMISKMSALKGQLERHVEAATSFFFRFLWR